jgi:hypothetical protein
MVVVVAWSKGWKYRKRRILTKDFIGVHHRQEQA